MEGINYITEVLNHATQFIDNLFESAVVENGQGAKKELAKAFHEAIAESDHLVDVISPRKD